MTDHEHHALDIVREKVDKIHTTVFNGLSENVAETRSDVKDIKKEIAKMSTAFVELKTDVLLARANRKSTCPVAKDFEAKKREKKVDVKYTVTTLVALAALVVSFLQ